MRYSFVFAIALCGSLFGQQPPERVVTMTAGFASSTHPVTGAPYSATVVNESVQTLADGNRIVQKTTGTTARDSQGRTRNEAALPMIGNLSPAAQPHLVFINDPVKQTSYTLNLDEKTAHVMNTKGIPGPPEPPPGPDGPGQVRAFISTGPMPPPDLPPPHAIGGAMVVLQHQKGELDSEQAETKTEDLGTQEIEGVNATGVRTTRTIAAGEIGNDKPIQIVTEVWTSPDLKTVVMSKRTDPRFGVQTFQLTNISRAEPDASLFTIPADFKTIQPDDKNIFFYRSKE